MIAVVYNAVEHLITRVIRDLPRTQLLAATTFWLIAFIILMIISVALILIVGLRLINQRKTRLGQSRYRLQITNKGNLVAHYLLRAQEPGNVLAFSFLLNGVELKPPSLPTIKPPETSPAPQLRTTQLAPAGRKAAPVSQPARPMPRSNFMKRTSQFRRAGQLGVSGPLARIIGGLSSLLPNSARTGMYQTTAKFRGAQYKVQQADNLAKGLGGFKMGGQKAAVQVDEKPVSARATQLSTTQLSTTDAPAEREQPQASGPQWLTTPAMSPGENLTVDLFITPRNPRLSQEYTFKILSRCAENEGHPELIESCNIQVKGISWLSYLWPYAALVISIIAILAVFSIIMRASLPG